jgi:UDP-glucose 4-epimerase
MKILLTGGSGFIGRNIRESFLIKKYEILSPSSQELNLADEKSVDTFFKKNIIDIVIHAAVKPGHRNAKDLSNLFYTNSRMFFNLERHKDEYKKMLILGSGAIYDMRNYHPKMKEEEWINNIPVDEHGYCKYVCEKIIEHTSNIFDLRIFGIFGKYEDYSIRFISNAICKTLFDLPITIKQNRNFDYLYINDLMPILNWFIENNPRYQAYNITPKTSISLYELALMIRKISGKDLPIYIAQDGMGLEYSGDNTRLLNEYPDMTFTTLEDSISNLYEWYYKQKSNIKIENLLFDK